MHCSDQRIKARLQDGAGGTYLWVANPVRQDIPVRIEIGDTRGPFSNCRSLWGSEASVKDRTVELVAGGRDVAVLELK